MLVSPLTKITRLIAVKEKVSVAKKDMRQVVLRDSKLDTGLSASRNIYKLKPGDTLAISRNGQWTAVASSKIYLYTKLRTSYSDDHYDWLLDWPTHTYEKKLVSYDKYCSHELNTYLKYRDPEFFEKVARKFIANKLIKTLVDLCLLNDPMVMNFTEPEVFSELICFEKCLIVDYLARNGRQELAQQITNVLRLKLENTRLKGEKFANAFNTVMKSTLCESRQRYDSDEEGGGGGGGGGPDGCGGGGGGPP